MSTHEPESSTGSGQSVSCPPRDGQRIRLDLARVTVNLPPKTQAALLNLMQQWGRTRPTRLAGRYGWPTCYRTTPSMAAWSSSQMTMTSRCTCYEAPSRAVGLRPGLADGRLCNVACSRGSVGARWVRG